MKNNIDGQINTLNEIAKGGIKEDKFHHEFKDVIDTLDSIKEEISKGGASKDQLKKIIDFLRQQIRTIPDGNFIMSNRLNSYKQDFKKILNNLNHETNSINDKSKTEINKILDEAIANGQITDETNKNKKEVNHIINDKIQNNFSNNGKQTFESILDLNNLTSYTVRSGDNLWNIVKKQYPSLTQSNKDIIHIINYIVNLNTKLEPKRLRHLMTDDKLAWGKKGSDGIAGDTLRIGDILKFPTIKTIKEEVTTPKVVIEKKEDKENPELIKEKKVLIIKASEIENEEVKNKILKEINECKTKECLNKIRDNINKIISEQENTGTIEKRTYWKTVGFAVDGENYIIGEDGEPKLITTQELTPEYKKSLEKYKDTLVLSENINLLLSALTQDGEDVSMYSKLLKGKINSFNPSELTKSTKDIEKTINNIFNALDIDNKDDIDLKSTISIYNYIRDELDNYELVRKQIAEKEFNNLTKVSEDELDAFIKDPTSNQTKLKNILGQEGFEDFQKEIIEKKAEANTYFIEHQKELIQQFPSVNINNIKDFIIDSFVGNFSKIAILEAYVEKNLTYKRGYIIKDTVYDENKGNDNIDLFADIQGVGTFDWSDKNLNYGSEAFKLIATEIAAIAAGMLTMGVGTYAVNAAVYGTRLLKYAKLTNRSFSALNKGGKALKVGKFAAMSTIEGGAFYAGYGALQSGVEGENMYTTEGLMQSVAFMGAFKALNGLYKAAGLTLDMSKPLMSQKVILGKQFIGEGITFSALGLGFEGILFEPGEWTAETIIQAFAMAAAFKGAGIASNKFKFRKRRDSRVEAVEAEIKEVYIHKNGKEYVKGTDGKYRDSDGNIRNVAEKNLRKKVNYTWSTEAPIDKNAKPLNPDGTKTTKTKIDTGSDSMKLKNEIDTIIKKRLKQSDIEKINTIEKDLIKAIASNDLKQIDSKINEINEIFNKRIRKIYNSDKTSTSKTFLISKIQEIQFMTIKYYQSLKFIKPKFNQKTIDNNKLLNEIDRISESEKLLGRKLSKEEQKAIIDAHNIDFNKGNLRNIKDKLALLEKFSKEERRILLDSGICGKSKVKASIGSKESANIKESVGNIFSKIKDSPELLKLIDKKLSKMPFHINKLYNFPKWFVYNSEKGVFRSIPSAIGNSIKTPYDVIANFKNAKGFKEHSKNILFANKDISFIKGILKMGGYAVVPTAIEEIFKFNTIEGYQIKLNPEDIAKDYAAIMYLGVVNTLIMEYLNDDTVYED